jgi:hypothetical protein
VFALSAHTSFCWSCQNSNRQYNRCAKHCIAGQHMHLLMSRLRKLCSCALHTCAAVTQHIVRDLAEAIGV